MSLPWLAFVAALAPGLRTEASRETEAIFGQRLAEAGIAPEDQRAFATYAGERIVEGPLADALKKLHIADLAFAFALAQGRTTALETFERDYVPGLVAAARKAVPSVDPADSMQEVRIHVLVGDADHYPRIRDYRGTGPLKGWLRLAVLRRSLNRATRSAKETPVEDAFFDALVDNVETSATSKYFNQRYQSSVKDALRYAVAQLSNREKALLQYAFIDGVPMDQIATTYRAHRTTISRWLELARDRVKREVEAYLREHCGLSASEAKAAMEQTMNAVDSTMRRLLAAR